MLRGRQSGPDASSRGGGTTIGTVCRTNPLWVEVDGREVGPLNASSGAAGVIEGDRVLIARHENDADRLTIVGILGRTPTSPGTVGGGAQRFTFATPAATWTVNHGLGRYPLVQLFDSVSAQFDADVEYPDLNTVVITHAVPTAGSALVI